MTAIKEDVKDVAIGVGYDFLIVGFIFSWIIAIIMALVEVSLWVVFGVFLLGCGFFFAVIFIGKKHEEKEKRKAELVEDELVVLEKESTSELETLEPIKSEKSD